MHFFSGSEPVYMVRLDRIEFVKLLLSVFAGIASGNIARTYFTDGIVGVLVTAIVLIGVYSLLDFADRRYFRAGNV